jgi:hypothetical protein
MRFLVDSGTGDDDDRTRNKIGILRYL